MRWTIGMESDDTQTTGKYQLGWRCLAWAACLIAIVLGFRTAAPLGPLLAGAGVGMISNIALPWESVLSMMRRRHVR